MAGCVRRFRGKEGVPAFLAEEYAPKTAKYCVCIPVINEGERILKELDRAVAAGTPDIADIRMLNGSQHRGDGQERREHAADKAGAREAGGAASDGILVCAEAGLSGHYNHLRK